ncbi:hypothetical protein [Lysinibacillus sp. NPDC059133]|uniref:hypothetical protein n=1 Tax=Lysinibacillus sp. NPDC059133 TaxID=3346737 RepID=UPI0036AA3233
MSFNDCIIYGFTNASVDTTENDKEKVEIVAKPKKETPEEKAAREDKDEKAPMSLNTKLKKMILVKECGE